MSKNLAKLEGALDILKTIIPFHDLKRGLVASTPGEGSVQRAITMIERSRRAAADFVLIQLRLGMEFADQSLNANHRKEQNLRTAKTAYEAVLKFLPRATFTSSVGSGGEKTGMAQLRRKGGFVR